MSPHIRSGVPHQGRGNGASLPSRALLVVVALLLIGAAALFWLPPSAFEQVGGLVSRLTSRTGAAPAETSSAPVAQTGTVAEAVTPAPVAAVEPMPPATPASLAQVESAPAAPASTDPVVFSARADSWITVTDGGGKQVLRRTVAAGETVGVTGSMPLAVVVGRASGVDVQVRGKPFDLAPVTKSGGVARFEIKP